MTAVQAATARLDGLHALLKSSRGIAGGSVKAATRQSFLATLAANLLVSMFLNSFFAAVIAFGVVYNSARIALSERARDLASLRVLGLTRGEISYILLGELAVLTLLALPLGFAMGYAMTYGLIQMFDFEVARFPFIVTGRTYALASVVVLAAAAISGLVVRRKLDRLDLVEVLKTRE